VLKTPDRPALYRRRELTDIVGILHERRPAVIELAGGPGMGKTSVIANVRRAAAGRGWAIARGGDEDRFAVDPRTRDVEFRRTVLASFREPDDSGVVRARRAAAVAARGPAVQSDPFVDELARLSPVLLLIDEYRPSPAFAQWFEASFLGAVRDSRMPIVVIVAAPDSEQSLGDLATDRIELAPLEPKLVRSILMGLDGKLDPPLRDDEIEVYVRGVQTPQLLDSLMRVLALASKRRGD
jgi:hypothetical protein